MPAPLTSEKKCLRIDRIRTYDPPDKSICRDAPAVIALKCDIEIKVLKTEKGYSFHCNLSSLSRGSRIRTYDPPDKSICRDA
ncbi:MAG: hypothetical protein KG029_01660, partial [Bacteroidetes bacterium]|nr:hypothetical protein [Bacteroidota bacterium]